MAIKKIILNTNLVLGGKMIIKRIPFWLLLIIVKIMTREMQIGVWIQ